MVISNYGGSVTSQVAQLVVYAPPALVYQMINGVITDTGRFAYDTVHQIVLYANATGTSLAYQWYKGNDLIDGATNATYSFYPTNTSQSDAYSVYISNAVDSLFTDNLYITVVPEITPPTISYYYSHTTPLNNSRVTNSPAVTLLGQANAAKSLTVPASVLVQQNGGAWLNASLTNASSTAVNWGINETLVPGTNTFIAQATDIYGNQSAFVTTTVIYVVPSPFTLLVSGPGSVATNWTGNLLEIGRNYTMTATPSNGFKFVGWSGGVSSTNPALTFMMQSNLVIQATFFETNPPTLAITNPASNSYFTNTGIVNVQGTAADNTQLAAVMWQVNSGPWTAASGTTNWTAAVGAAYGTNVFRAYSVDGGNNYSPTNSLTFIYVALDKLTVLTNGQGTLNTNYAGQLLYLGQTYSITATANTNNAFVFTNWTGSTGTVLTNGATLRFVMQSNLTVQANFADIQPPTVTITTNLLPVGPATNAIVLGTAADNDRVVAVNFQWNGGVWTLASGTNNWSAAVNLIPGTNTFTVYSVDAWGNKSPTNALLFTKSPGGVTLVNLLLTYDGTDKSVTPITTPTNLTVNLTYNGTAAAPTNVGSYTVVGTVLDANYLGSATNTLVIGKAAASLFLANLTPTYDGTAKPVTATTTPTNLTVNVTYNGASAAPTNAGSYTVIGSVVDANYQGSSTNTLVIGQATAGVLLTNLVQTYDGTAKLVTASTTPTNLTVNVTYNGATAAPTNASSYTVVGSVVDANYQGSSTNTLVIGQATAVVSLTNLVQTYDGTAKPVAATTTPTNLTVNVTYNGASAAPTNAGSYTVIGSVVDANYQGGVTNTLVINPPVVTLPLHPLLQMRVTNGNVWLTWPQAYSNFVLQSVSDLKGVWNSNSASPSVLGTNLQITLPATNRQQFYRLSQ